MNNKTIIWTAMFLVLVSFVCAELEVEMDTYLTPAEQARLNGDTDGMAVVILNGAKLKIYNLNSWLDALSDPQPAISQAMRSDLDESIENFKNRYNLNAEERAIIDKLTEEQQLLLTASLGRAQADVAMVPGWTMRLENELHNYVIAHELMHTYTNPMFTAEKQVEMVEQKMALVSGDRKDEMMEKLDYLKARAQPLQLWREKVGGPEEAPFSNYGKTNEREPPSEFYAKFTTKGSATFFSKELAELNSAVDTGLVRRYIAAFVLADCFGLLNTQDPSKGSIIKSQIMAVIENDLGKKEIFEQLQLELAAEVTCPLTGPEEISYSGDAYLCQQEGGEVKSCKFTKVSELVWNPEMESIYFGYNRKGEIVDVGFYDAYAETVSNFADPLSEFGVITEIAYKPSDAPIIVPKVVPGMTVELYPIDPVTGKLPAEPVVKVNPGNLGRGGSGLSQSEIEAFDRLEQETGKVFDIYGTEQGEFDQCIAVSDGGVVGPAVASENYENVIGEVNIVKQMAIENRILLDNLAIMAMGGDHYASGKFLNILFGRNVR